jgi:hypothetical protein
MGTGCAVEPFSRDGFRAESPDLRHVADQVPHIRRCRADRIVTDPRRGDDCGEAARIGMTSVRPVRCRAAENAHPGAQDPVEVDWTPSVRRAKPVLITKR